MKLNKILFHSYRSLVNVELQVNHNCIGFVGINESGKSNILSAIHVLGGEKKLTEADTPKMVKNDPFLTFCFELSDDEYNNIHDNCKNQFKKYLPDFCNDILTQKTVNFNIGFSKDKNDEYRYFEFSGIEVSENLLILLSEKTISNYQIMTKNGVKNIDDCYIITSEDYQLNIELEQKADKLSEMMDLLHQKEDELSNLIKMKTMESDEKEEVEFVTEVDNVEKKVNTLLSDNEFILNNEISGIKNDIQIFSEELKDYKIPSLIVDIEKKNTSLNVKIKENTVKKTELMNELKTLTQAQTEKKTEIEQQTTKIEQTIQKYKKDITENEKTIALLSEKVSEKYTKDNKIFLNYIIDLIKKDLFSFLPKVVLWEYNEKYLQESIVNLEEILQQNDLGNLPRPLVNIFRICFGIKTLDEIKLKIKEAQNDRYERSRISDQLTESVNVFLKKIWIDYNQDINITIEEKELRVAVVDPVKKHASYYSLVERSQGCRTFISFLLTIGAEATKGVLKNSILLLDEPETHLHPSGVKFMLQELIKIADKENNKVFYATHSMFMIDRNDFSRHVIVEKKEEKTNIKYALSDRIGYFMQEEVLYNALNIGYGEFDSTNKINFVFEGYGDTVIFKNTYSSLQKNILPFKLEDCVFHHGGGCDNIEKYLNYNPIRIGTKWFFILDSDKPAENLIKYIKNKYKDNIDKDIFIFQYNCEKLEQAELEDLLSDEIKLSIYNNVLGEINIDEVINNEQYLSLIKGQLSFTKQFKEICNNFSIVEKNIKATFKEKLNNLLESDTKDIKSKDELFKKKYSDYYKWFEGVIKLLRENSVTKKEKNDTKESP